MQARPRHAFALALALAPIQALVGCSSAIAESGGVMTTLGETASDACRAAMAEWAPLKGAADAASASATYEGSALQSYIQASDAAGERGDDLTISAALEGGDLATATASVEVALLARLRLEIAAPEALVDDPRAAWDEAHCLWEGAIQGLAAAGEAAGDPTLDAGLVTAIEGAFADGHAAIEGEAPTASFDEWVLPPAKQVIEKNLFRALHRLLLAEAAEGVSDPGAAARALAHFGGLRDRLEGRNTPGIAIIEDMLADPATIDVEELGRQLAIAFAKRTRAYASAALDDGAIGTPSGYKGAIEGRTYLALVLPAMVRALGDAGLDAAAIQASWDDYADAVRTGDDIDRASALSEELVQWLCAYQATLGIAACTGSDDEPSA
ncbi:MAG: hypothetical protein H6710_21625 [Myxococcales bacterium]|nr:hypothetical protein [Myxococcales bacterium]